MLGKFVGGGGSAFNYGVRIYNLGLTAYVLEHLHERCIAGPLKKKSTNLLFG